jgi:hypothetical protein
MSEVSACEPPSPPMSIRRSDAENMPEMMYQTDYRCYCCHRIVPYQDLAYECMRYHEDFPHLRGLCRSCKHLQQFYWKTIPEPDHYLVQVHQLSEEWIAYWSKVAQVTGQSTPQYLVDKEGRYIFYYYEGPDGEPGDPACDWYNDERLRRKYLKTVAMPPPPERKCNCCYQRPPHGDEQTKKYNYQQYSKSNYSKPNYSKPNPSKNFKTSTNFCARRKQ